MTEEQSNQLNKLFDDLTIKVTTMESDLKVVINGIRNVIDVFRTMYLADKNK